MDIDSFFHTPEDGWIILEFLKCDTVPPEKSDPTYYWKKNWRKFATLWALANQLGGRLILINYCVPYGLFKIMEVNKMVPGEDGSISKTEQVMDFAAFQKWYQNLNERSGGLWST